MNSETSISLPLQGIKILDISRLLPGPLATQMLADMGAEVIKIEDTNSPDYIRFFPPFIGDDSALYLSLNRNKRSIVLNFKSEKGKAIFLELIKSSDVVVEQFRPGVLDKMGIGFEEARKVNPKIIYVSVTGYGQTGPYSQKAGHDLNYISISGILSTIGTKEKPIIPGVQISDVAASYAAVNGCLAAIIQKEKTGEGQHVDISMTDSVMPFAALINAAAWTDGRDIERGNFQLSGELANYNVYECADGKYIAFAALEPKFWLPFCDAVKKPEWKDKIIALKEDIDKLKEEISILFKSKSREEWEVFSEQHDVCISPILEISEIESNKQIRERNMVLEMETGGNKKLKTIGSPIKFSGSNMRIPQFAPKLGKDTDTILLELGFDEQKIKDLRSSGIVL